MKKRRYLKKIGTDRMFGWTPVLAKKKDMVECDANGRTIISAGEVETSGVPSIRIWELAMEFRTLADKKLEEWLNANAIEINALSVDIQGMIIQRWQKANSAQPMPDCCTFMISGSPETGEPIAEEDTGPAVNMEE